MNIEQIIEADVIITEYSEEMEDVMFLSNEERASIENTIDSIEINIKALRNELKDIPSVKEWKLQEYQHQA